MLKTALFFIEKTISFYQIVYFLSDDRLLEHKIFSIFILIFLK